MKTVLNSCHSLGFHDHCVWAYDLVYQVHHAKDLVCQKRGKDVSNAHAMAHAGHCRQIAAPTYVDKDLESKRSAVGIDFEHSRRLRI